MNNRIRIEFGVEAGIIKLTYRDQKGDHSLYVVDAADAARAAIDLSAKYGRLSPMLGTGIDSSTYTDIMREVRKKEQPKRAGSEYFYIGKHLTGGHRRVRSDHSGLTPNSQSDEKARHLVVQEGVKIIISGDSHNDDSVLEGDAKNLAS